MRRRTIAPAGSSPTPAEPYLDVVPKTVWLSDYVPGECIVLSNTGWILE